MKKICFIIYDFTKKGGAERASAKLANALVDCYDITIISVFNELNSYAYEIDDKIKVKQILKTKGSILKNIKKIETEILDIVKEQKIQLIISVDVATALISVIASKLSRRRMILCDRSSSYNENMYSKRSLRIYAWLGIHFCDKLQVMTEDGKKGWLDKYKMKESDICVIPNWIDENAITDNLYKYNQKRIITVGRATPEKNYEELLLIANRLRDISNGWEWHIWGDFSSEYGQKIRESIMQQRLDKFVFLKGVTNNIYEEYPKYSFFVLTSKFEGMPNVLLEAQGSKLPTIAYDCKTGPSELIIDNVNGFLVPLNNTEKMVIRIKQLMQDENLANSFSSNSNCNYKKYSKETILEMWKNLIEGELS